MVKSTTTSITPAQHASNHSIGGTDPLALPLLVNTHDTTHEGGGSDPIYCHSYDKTGVTTLHDNATTRSIAGTTTLTKVKATTLTSVVSGRVGFDGGLKISFRVNTANANSYGQIWRNGSPVGTLQGPTGDATYVETIAGWADGDEIELYIKDNGGGGNMSGRSLLIVGTMTATGLTEPIVGTANDP